jgi:hypothetical protein
MVSCLLMLGRRDLERTRINAASIARWIHHPFCAKQHHGTVITFPSGKEVGCGGARGSWRLYPKRKGVVIACCCISMFLLIVVMVLRCCNCWKVVWPFGSCSSEHSGGARSWVQGWWPRLKLLAVLLATGSHLWVLWQVRWKVLAPSLCPFHYCLR